MHYFKHENTSFRGVLDVYAHLSIINPLKGKFSIYAKSLFFRFYNWNQEILAFSLNNHKYFWNYTEPSTANLLRHFQIVWELKDLTRELVLKTMKHLAFSRTTSLIISFSILFF